MSQYPPMQPAQPQYGGPTTPIPGRSISGAAIGSLICGILGCVPFITSLIAVVLGIIGIKATANPAKSGRGFAIAGLILGVLGIAGWALFGGTILWGLSEAKKLATNEARPFVEGVIAGDYAKASKHTMLTEAEMRVLHDQMQGWGSLSDIKVTGFDAQKNAGTPGRVVLKGNATFTNAGSKEMEVVMDSSTGQMKIVGIHFK